MCPPLLLGFEGGAAPLIARKTRAPHAGANAQVLFFTKGNNLFKMHFKVTDLNENVANVMMNKCLKFDDCILCSAEVMAI